MTETTADFRMVTKMANGRTTKWRDVTSSFAACYYVMPIVQYCHLL